MIRINKTTAILIFALCFFSNCGQKKADNNQKLDITGNQVENLWLNCCELNVQATIVEQTGKELKLDLFVYSPSFLDKGSRDLLLSLFIYELHLNFDYHSVSIKYTDEKFEYEPFTINYDLQKINSIVDSYEKTPKFLKYAKYSVKTFTPEEIIRLNAIIPQIHNLLKEDFPKKKDFWEILYEYSTKEMSQSQFNIYIELASLEEVGINKRKFDFFYSDSTTVK